MAKAGEKKLVIVESPTKAKTIRKFLGKNFDVESCMGHVRDLPQSAKDIPEKFKKKKWANLGVDVENDFEPIYCVPKNKDKIVKDLRKKLEDADELILATDEDREGESISWHLLELLKPKVPVRRMVFHEITQDAIQDALKNFRQVDDNLVRAQEARRILDRLVGYTISPLLWKKVAYGLSAGRVQSVAVRLIAEREHERIRFKKSNYWSLLAELSKDKVTFEARSLEINGKRVATSKDFDSETGKLLEDKKNSVLHLNEADANKWADKLETEKFKVVEVDEKPVSRKPPAPFITSTLQQESNRKLGLSARETMQVAQKLYENGLITYMRTDSTNLSAQAITAARKAIKDRFGAEYLPKEAREYAGKKVKGAQEAHEAIRPAGTAFVEPDKANLSGVARELYELIWKRTLASQMVNSQQKQTSVRFEVGDTLFTSSGMAIDFPGFLKVYVEDEEKEERLPKLKVGDVLTSEKLNPVGHETKPPARFTEASLIQMMEKEGIGRPSTYASIIGTIQDRGYVRKAGNALVPTFTALVVTKLLKSSLPDYVDLGFTSEMEKSLDSIAEGDLDSIKYLKSIYGGNQGLQKQVEKHEKNLDGEETRSIKLEGLDNLIFKVGRYGAYVCQITEDGEEVCASIPDAATPGEMTEDQAVKWIEQKKNGNDVFGKHPATNQNIYVLNGRYGPYVQLGENEKSDKDEKPKRISIPATIQPESLTLKQAIDLLDLPKSLGKHPTSGKDIKKGIGRFGPYVVHDGDYRSIPKTMALFDVELKQALELFAQPKKGRGRAAALKEFAMPGSEEKIQLFNGKYGPYVKLGKVNVSLPEGTEPEKLTAEMAIELIKSKEKPAKASKSKATKEPKAPKKTGAKAAKKKKT